MNHYDNCRDEAHQSAPSLQACPFCGGTDISQSSWDVKCSDCGAEMPGGIDRARIAWNRRHPASAVRPQATAPVVSEPMIWQARDQNGHWVNCVNKETAEHVAEMNGGEIRPLYASPQPSAVITEERVERAKNAYGQAMIDAGYSGAVYPEWMRAALEAAMKEA